MIPTDDGVPVLITPSSIVAIRNRADGIEVFYRRPDGCTGRWLTGARSAQPDA